jgi:hypothetical protein
MGEKGGKSTSRWSSCRAESIPFFLGTICVGHFVHFASSLDGKERVRERRAAGMVQSLLFKGQPVWGVLYILPDL